MATISPLSGVAMPKFAQLQLQGKCSRARYIRVVHEELRAIDEKVFHNLLRVHRGYLLDLC